MRDFLITKMYQQVMKQKIEANTVFKHNFTYLHTC